MAYLGPENPVTVRAPRDVFAGEPVLIGKLFGLAIHAARAGHPVALRTTGVFCLPRAEGVDFGLGDPVHFDPEAGRVCRRRKGCPPVGVSLEATVDGGSRLRFLVRPI